MDNANEKTCPFCGAPLEKSTLDGSFDLSGKVKLNGWINPNHKLYNHDYLKRIAEGVEAQVSVALGTKKSMDVISISLQEQVEQAGQFAKDSKKEAFWARLWAAISAIAAVLSLMASICMAFKK